MDAEPKPRHFPAGLLAVVLWLISFVLGLQGIYALPQIIGLLGVRLGASVKIAGTAAYGLIFFLAIGFLIFIIASTEYHVKRVGKPESWRLFGWTIAVELAIVILYYIL
jgi:hypothetical protein